jgi:hypothetical protein
MSNDDQTRSDLYARVREEYLGSQRMNADAYDRSILALSSAFLALSISFIKDIAPAQGAVFLPALYVSWILFALTILLALAGMLIGIWVFKRLIDKAYSYSIDRDEAAYKSSSRLARVVDGLNWAVGVLFTLAVASTIVFAIANFERGLDMGEDRSPDSAPERIERSQPANTMPKVPTQSPSGGENKPASPPSDHPPSGPPASDA